MGLQGVKRGEYRYRTKENKRVIVTKALDLAKKGESLTNVAIKLHVPRATLQRLLSSDELWADYKKKKQQVLSTQFSEVAQKASKEVLKRLKKQPGDIKAKDLSLISAIAYDKAYPFPTTLQQFNIGDVKMPKYFRPRGKKPYKR